MCHQNREHPGQSQLGCPRDVCAPALALTAPPPACLTPRPLPVAPLAGTGGETRGGEVAVDARAWCCLRLPWMAVLVEMARCLRRPHTSTPVTSLMRRPRLRLLPPPCSSTAQVCWRRPREDLAVAFAAKHPVDVNISPCDQDLVSRFRFPSSSAVNPSFLSSAPARWRGAGGVYKEGSLRVQAAGLSGCAEVRLTFLPHGPSAAALFDRSHDSPDCLD